MKILKKCSATTQHSLSKASATASLADKPSHSTKVSHLMCKWCVSEIPVESLERLEKVALADGYKVVSFEGQFYCLHEDITGRQLKIIDNLLSVAERIVH